MRRLPPATRKWQPACARAAWTPPACPIPARGKAAAAFGALLASAVPAQGWAQAGGLAPATGLDDASVNGVRSALDSYQRSPPPRAVGPNWQVSPSLGVDVGVTDNAYRVASPRRADVFTLITPSVVVNGDTAHIQANAAYSPVISVYANNSSQTRIDQFGQAGALVTFIPDTLFLDLRGSVSESSLTGGFGTADQRGFNRNNQVTTLALSATPYVQRRFGGWGTGLLSYNISQTLQDTPYGNTLAVNGNGGLPAFYGSSGNLTTQRERGLFTTGENLGRVNNVTELSATQYDGSGSYRGAFRNEATNTTSYALTRAVSVSGTIGYQNLHYAGFPPYNVDQPEWRLGGRYAPSPNLNLGLSYGRRDGFNDFAADGSWFPTARTALFASYTTGLTSTAEDYQNTLQTTSVGPAGQLTNRTTGAPVQGTTGFFGTQNNIFQLRRLSVSGLLSYDRDSFSVTVSNEQRTSVNQAAANAGTGVVPAGTNTNGTFGSVSWGHTLSDRLSSTVIASYGVNDNGNALGLGSGSQTSFSGAASLNYIFTPTLTGRVVYTHTEVTGAGNGFNGGGFNSFGSFVSGTYTENALLAGLRKSF